MTNVKPSPNVMRNGKSNAKSGVGDNPTPARTIQGVNALPDDQKRAVYARLIPPELFERFQLDSSLLDCEGRDLLTLNCLPKSSVAEMALYHQFGFPDPLLYGQMADTLNGQVHVLLYILNDPDSPRFDVDRLPDGRTTKFGTLHRNLEAELEALRYGLAPGQIRRGPRLLGSAIQSFERFVASLGHDFYFTEPLYYHNAILFERYGFSYEKGRKLMMRIQEGFTPDGDLTPLLDGSTPFRNPEAAPSIRLRSWAIHDNLLGEPFTGVTMYKRIGHPADLDTSNSCEW